MNTCLELSCRYKNIPGWGALHDAFPGASWYISIDDDAYWIMENFLDFIHKFDPDKPVYMGNPYSFSPSRNLVIGEEKHLPKCTIVITAATFCGRL